MRKVSGQFLYLAAVLAASCLVVGAVAVDWASSRQARATPRQADLRDIPFDGRQAYEYVEQLCKLGPRPSGSAAMQAQRELLVEHFESLGAQVELQTFDVRHPLDGSAVRMANVVARWHPERRTRILLCAHYDTRPFPDLDPRDPRGIFLGANDGASGVAVLMELARSMSDLEGRLGVDFALFDGEELVFDERGEYFLGSTHFARKYAADTKADRYRWGVLLDMVGDADLQVYQEVNSVRWPETRPLVHSIWNTARRLGVREFVARPRHEVRDDHLPLRNIGGIATCNVIDFDYPQWHTTEDTPDNCSALSLAKVGWVVQEWLKTAVK
ncbi:MAG: M28 family peptidase [Pirellulales bacterium]